MAKKPGKTPKSKGVKKRERKPTTRQRKYVKNRMEGKSGVSAAIDAGYSETTAHNATERIDSAPAVKALFRVALEKAGVTDELLARRVNQELYAMETKLAHFKGRFIDRVHLVDWGRRHAAVELALKLRGDLTEKVQHGMDETLSALIARSLKPIPA